MCVCVCAHARARVRASCCLHVLFFNYNCNWQGWCNSNCVHTFILEVLGLNLSWVISYHYWDSHCFSQFLEADAETVPLLGHSSSVSFPVHHASFSLTLYSLSYWQQHKINHEKVAHKSCHLCYSCITDECLPLCIFVDVFAKSEKWVVLWLQLGESVYGLQMYLYWCKVEVLMVVGWFFLGCDTVMW